MILLKLVFVLLMASSVVVNFLTFIGGVDLYRKHDKQVYLVISFSGVVSVITICLFTYQKLAGVY